MIANSEPQAWIPELQSPEPLTSHNSKPLTLIDNPWNPDP